MSEFSVESQPDLNYYVDELLEVFNPVVEDADIKSIIIKHKDLGFQDSRMLLIDA